MFLSLHMIFRLQGDAVVCVMLERISGLDPSFEMIDTWYLKLSTASSLWPPCRRHLTSVHDMNKEKDRNINKRQQTQHVLV